MSEITKKIIFLIILDGWGYRAERTHNAIALANKPFFDSLWNKYPHAFLQASEENVGLPKGQMGDSETGHHVIGAGRVPESDLVRISSAIKNGEFENNESFKRLFDHVKQYDSTLHIEGMLGPGGIHSHTDHLYAFLRTAKDAGIKKIAIHVFTDGHDTPPQSAGGYIDELQDFLYELGVGFIATISGRYFAMDRDNNWDRVKKTEEAIFESKGRIFHLQKGKLLVEQLYEGKDIDDNLIEPIVCQDDNNNTCRVSENDGVFFFNFRPDRARMLSKLTIEIAQKCNIYFVTMTEYDKNLKTDIAFPPETLFHTLGEEISNHKLKQAHIAESEKFAHATYFFNGGRQDPYEGEEDILITSIKEIDGKPITGYDQVPQMKASEIVDEAIKQIEKGTDFVFINFANLDMIGHTGNEGAIIKAAEFVDQALSRLIPLITEKGGIALITADHGNAETNIDPINGHKHTAHTINPVPVIITDEKFKIKDGSLANVAPTILDLFNLPKPIEMTADSLIIDSK